MQADRDNGVLLHVTALSGPDGIGTLGAPARTFVDWLDRAGVGYWQFCPLGPTASVHGHSPYQSVSAFAGNPLLVDLDELVNWGWLPADALDDRPIFDEHKVHFDRVQAYKEPKLRVAFETFDERASDAEKTEFGDEKSGQGPIDERL